MKQNWNKESLLAAYPRFEAQPDFYLGRMADAEKGFADTFGKEAERFFSAPGRTEIGGNHTDHQHGCVLAAAVDLDIFGAAAKNDSRIIRIFSEGYGMEEISLDDLEVKKKKSTQQLLSFVGWLPKSHRWAIHWVVWICTPFPMY